ncbi:MAG: MarR family transcriptional regulator [Notoacmeibacter sp.]
MSFHFRSSQALRLWREVTEQGVRDAALDLTQRQLALLLIIYLETPPHTVRALAARLNVTKPVITRALNTMGEMELVDRYRDPKDKRNVLIKLTVAGSQFLEGLSERIILFAKELPL